MTFAAECEDCKEFWDTGNRDADRMAARRHADRRGHRVCAVTSRITYYVGTPTPDECATCGGTRKVNRPGRPGIGGSPPSPPLVVGHLGFRGDPCPTCSPDDGGP